MITKINQLKSQTSVSEVKALCESTISAISSAIYNGVTPDAQNEIERVALTNLFKGLERYSSDKAITEWLNNQKRIYSVKNLGVRSAVNNLLKNEKENATLVEILEGYRDQLNSYPEVMLYESFTSALSGFGYLPSVNTELSAVAERVKKYQNDVDISKIVEVMKGTRSDYLIPLIEDVVENYLNNKTEQNKSSLKETLVKFSYDPFIRDIINLVTLDATQLQLEYANAECDIEDRIFSPIMYLGENETLFNIKGSYYVRKGNNINKLKNAEVQMIDESFKNLCNIVNDPGVFITKNDIKIYAGKDSAILTEHASYVNGTPFDDTQINETMQVAKWSGNEAFFGMLGVLRENFNEIAELDFVKRVYLKEDENYAADIFKLRDNVFITTFDSNNNKATFYRNINPIQAEKIMMEHMRYDVSKTFADILPNKEKILSEISETKKDFTDYIVDLENKIQQFAASSDPTSAMVVEALNEELAETKNDYKNYLNRVEKFTTASPDEKKTLNENLNITVQDDGTGKSYTVVVPTGMQAAKGAESTGQVNADGDMFGSEVGMSSMSEPGGGSPSSAITFDDSQSELLSDSPSMEDDKVDLQADDVEAYADKVDAEAEIQAQEDQPTDLAGEPGAADANVPPVGDTEDMGGGDLGGGGELPDLGDTGEQTGELDLGGEPTAPADQSAEPPVEPSTENPENPATPAPEDPNAPKEEAAGPPDPNLEKTNFAADKNPGDLDQPKKIKKVFLKRLKK